MSAAEVFAPVPSPGDAKRRALVELDDGRTGRLVFVPPAERMGKARVELRPGVFLSVLPGRLRVVSDAAPAGVSEVVTPCGVCGVRQALVTVAGVDWCASCALEGEVAW